MRGKTAITRIAISRLIRKSEEIGYNQSGAGAEPAPFVAYGLYASTMFVGTS